MCQRVRILRVSRVTDPYPQPGSAEPYRFGELSSELDGPSVGAPQVYQAVPGAIVPNEPTAATPDVEPPASIISGGMPIVADEPQVFIAQVNLPVPVNPGLQGSGQAIVPTSFVDAPLVSIGDITVTRDSVLVPQGRFPLRGTTWTVQDSTQATESIPVWAIVMTVLFVWLCLLGLLFLLAKEKRYSGFVAVTVVGDGGLYHSVQFPAGPTIVGWVTTRVNQARSLAAVA